MSWGERKEALTDSDLDDLGLNESNKLERLAKLDDDSGI
jgi:hypothetical protein